VAAEGEVAEPRVPSPPAVRPLFGFTRLSAAAYGRLRDAVDGDDDFRARVAAAADEATVGRAGWLWLTRPEGWEDDPVFGGVPDGRPTPSDPGVEAGGDAGTPAQNRAARREAKLDAKLARAREQASQADEGRRRAVRQRDEARAEVDALRAEVEAVAARVAELEGERNAAVRAQKALEAELSAVRHDLSVAREATRRAEVRADRPDEGIDALAARHAVEAAAAAAADLGRALAEAAAALQPDAGTEPAAAPRAGSAGRRAGTRRGGGDRRTGRRWRRAPAVPAGMVADSPEAHRWMVADPATLVVVDGYNLAREAWSGLAPEEERRRTVALLEEQAHRSGGPVTVVFDGDDDAVAPAASRVVRVRFSASGTTADEAIAALVATLPAAQPVLVVSTDREVADDARRQGAAVMSSAAFLRAVGR
jgi:predicted RNA-binding protein with PIN domain